MTVQSNIHLCRCIRSSGFTVYHVFPLLEYMKSGLWKQERWLVTMMLVKTDGLKAVMKHHWLLQYKEGRRDRQNTHTHPSTPDSHRDTQNNIMLCECVRGGGSGGSRAAAFENGVTLWSAVFLGRNSNYCMFVQWGAPYVVQQTWLMFHSELTQSIQLFDGIFFLFFLQMQNI